MKKTLILFLAALLLFLGACESSDVSTGATPNNNEKKSEAQNSVLVPSSSELPLDKLQEDPSNVDSSYITWYVDHQEEFIKAANNYYEMLKYVQNTDDNSSVFKEKISKEKREYLSLGQLATINQLKFFYNKTNSTELKMSYDYYYEAIMEVARALDLEYNAYLKGNYLQGEELQIEDHLIKAQSYFNESYKIVKDYLKYEKWKEKNIPEQEKNNPRSEKNAKEEQAGTYHLSLDEMRKKAKEFVDKWNGYDNILLDEWDFEEVRVYEFKDGPAERSISVTVNNKTGEVNPDQGMY